MKPFEFEFYDEKNESYSKVMVKKTAENSRNSCVAEKRIDFKLYKILIPNFDTQIEDLNEYCIKISCLYL